VRADPGTLQNRSRMNRAATTVPESSTTTKKMNPRASLRERRVTETAMTIEIIVGLPHLNRGPLLERAIKRGYPVLISANALSRWDRREGYPRWMGWKLRPLANASDLVSIDLDSAGFVAARHYGGLPWTVDDYIALAASYPFRRFASLDLCTEAEIARDRDEVLDRIARTIALNHACHARAADRGIDTRLMPVIQGRRPDDYLRCLDGIAGILRPGMIVGVGSMCRREVFGPEGLLAVLSALDRVADPELRFHAFGVKGTALRYLRPLAHRVASIDSCAYGLAARIEAWREGFSKTDDFVADHMERWQDRQQARLAQGDTGFQHHLPLVPQQSPGGSAWDTAIALARTQIRALIEEGEIAHEQITAGWVAQWAMEILHSHD